MGEMQMFTCQWVPLGPAPRGGQGERCPPPQGSQGTRLHGGGAGFSEGGSVKSSRRKGILFRRKKGFRAGQCWGEQCRLWSRGGGGGGIGAETTRKGWCWEEPAFQEVQEVHRNESYGVIYSLFSRFFQLWQNYLGARTAAGFVCPSIALHDLLPTPFLVSHQAPLFLPLKCIFTFFFTSIQSAHYCQTIVSKISLGLCHLPAQKPFSAFYCHWSSMDTSPCRKPSTMRCQLFTWKTTRSSHQSGSITDLSLDVTPFLETFF